ncbi:MAG: UDP-N-acetylglucosamine--N-acetylmuramyl-(pentapeptide) pyrophosphoryl-undecaprenol N-acetylglucosamine transferase [Opitutae bacterium]|nr:UDP-N-acetylglucosamine--N-acetylmuramyl-(pentapeptide) pyrophosphoryl-undecaprenol N-acetylglucosamine transferase [Opitutae bacterium]
MSRFLISCGGTGGHLSPGIALAEGLTARGHEVTLLISRKKVDSRLIEKYPQLRFVRIPGSGFGWNPVTLARFVLSQTQGLIFSLRLVGSARPHGIIGFGGFTSASIILAGVLRRVPVVLHEANRVPGRAVRLLGGLAQRVYLPPGIRLNHAKPAATRSMGLPVRREIVRSPQETARVALGLHPHGKVLAVLGGSQGASALNDWVRRELPALAAEEIQVVCLTGLGKDIPETLELQARNGHSVRAIFMPFCDRMAELMSAADLVVSRAGAGTIAELVRCEAPAILIPYPHAADDHQRANAKFFEQQGGGLVIEQAFLATLRAEVVDTIFNDWLLRKFRANLRRMERANSLELMLDDLEQVVAPPRPPEPKERPASAQA